MRHRPIKGTWDATRKRMGILNCEKLDLTYARIKLCRKQTVNHPLIVVFRLWSRILKEERAKLANEKKFKESSPSSWLQVFEASANQKVQEPRGTKFGTYEDATRDYKKGRSVHFSQPCFSVFQFELPRQES